MKKNYSDGTIATGPKRLPKLSPKQQEAKELKVLNKKWPKQYRILKLLDMAENIPRPKATALDHLEFLRDQNELSKQEFSIVIGMAYTHYTEFLRGKRPLPLKAIKRAYALGVPADALLAGESVK